MTRAGEQNHHDFAALVDDANRGLQGAVDFAILPGDNADDGTADQFKLVADIASDLAIPLHILPGDHDFKQRSLRDFYQRLAADVLPSSSVVKGHRCLFLDVVSHGSGGPDFRLDATQLSWIASELLIAKKAQQDPIVFMHTYPADLKEGRGALGDLLKRYGVVMVDMGHTHYNELANGGQTIFATTRSTGQLEEDAVGFSTVAVDQRVVSWCFKPLTTSWPWVQITSPADHRLITDVRSAQQVIQGSFAVRAKVWGSTPIKDVYFQLGKMLSGPMAPVVGEPALWQADIRDIDSIPDGVIALTVNAYNFQGKGSSETIRIQINCNGAVALPFRHADGSDRDAIGAWLEKGILGTQLGPNRNGKKW